MKNVKRDPQEVEASSRLSKRMEEDLMFGHLDLEIGGVMFRMLYSDYVRVKDYACKMGWDSHPVKETPVVRAIRQKFENQK